MDLLSPFCGLTMEKEICASSNHRKSMKTETSKQIPQKLAIRLDLVLLFVLTRFLRFNDTFLNLLIDSTLSPMWRLVTFNICNASFPASMCCQNQLLLFGL